MAVATAKGKPRYRYQGMERTKQRAGLLFVAPALLHFLIFTSIPVFVAVGISFTNYSPLGGGKFIGIQNYIKMISDELFWTALKNTLVYSFWTVPVTMALALFLALILNRKLRALAWYRAAFYMPQVTATVAIAVVWMWMFNNQFGVINWVLEGMGLKAVEWLTSPTWAMPAIVIMSVWRGLGGTMVIFLAAQQGIPDYLYEAARIDGANDRQIFWRITLPLLAPATFFLLVTGLIGSFQVFDSIYVMTGGGPSHATTTIAHQIYEQAFQFTKMGYASAEAVVLTIVVFIITVINMKYVKSDADYV